MAGLEGADNSESNLRLKICVRASLMALHEREIEVV